MKSKKAVILLIKTIYPPSRKREQKQFYKNFVNVNLAINRA